MVHTAWLWPLYAAETCSCSWICCNKSCVREGKAKAFPLEARCGPEGLGSRIFMTFGTWRWWGRQPYTPATFTPGMFLVLIFTRGWVDPRDMVRSEGNMSLKNSVTPPGIDPGTIRLVAQRINHYATPDLGCVRIIAYCMDTTGMSHLTMKKYSSNINTVNTF
jgi:hypothetical protein